MMCLFQLVCVFFLAVIARTQELQSCNVDAVPSIIGSTEDAGALATAILGCPDGSIAVQWVGEVFVEETIRVTNGTSLDITGAGPGAIADGGSTTQLFYVEGGSSLHLSDLTLTHGNASNGGAISVNQSSASLTGNISFVSNSAVGNRFNSDGGAGAGGAIFVWRSNLSWEVDDAVFSKNTAEDGGGAIFAWESTVSWNGDGAEFSNNAAGQNIGNGEENGSGGAIFAWESTVTWNGGGSEFRNNTAGLWGGAIATYSGSTVFWSGDVTEFSANAAGYEGGAISATVSNVSWEGDGTVFVANTADLAGGAIAAVQGRVSWKGDGTEFSNNAAAGNGAAIFASYDSFVSMDDSTTFRSNVAGGNGGALAISELTEFEPVGPFIGTAFIDNRAGFAGGAIYLINCEKGLNFTDVTFESNSASGSGGAVAAFTSGYEFDPMTFTGCTFLNNKADSSGGAVEILTGYQELTSCEFVGNSADVGGALRLGGTASVSECSFVSNSATSRGPAVAVVVPSNSFSGLSFERNELYCEAGLFRQDTDEAEPAARYETVCFDCPGWDECSDCTIERETITAACEASLEHTTTDSDGAILETLNISRGYWRATNKSDVILACYNADACIGGQTGAEDFCAQGYTGPYCAVCGTDFSTSPGHTCTHCSTSRRQGLMAATAIAALVAILAVVVILKYLLSMKVGEKNIGWFHRRVLRAVPVQALKIIVVVWQILTQFADAASVTYPGVYQDFLSMIDFINFDFGSVLSAGCIWTDIDFHDRLVISTVWPLVVVGILAMTFRVAVRRNDTLGDAAVTAKIFHKHLTALLLLTFLVYSSVSSTVFQTFACETLDDGVEYLRADYRIHCTDAKHEAFEVYAGIMVLVYPVGIPLLYAVLLFERRDVLAHASADKTKAQSISGLWEPYTPDRFYYEVVECGRRVMLTGVTVFIFPNDAAQIAITMLIAFFFFAVFEILSPYKSGSDRWLSRGGHVIVYLSMFDLLLRKVDVSGERDESQAAFAGVLVAGHVLMIVVIFVEVVGICYASGKQEGGIKVSSESISGSRPRVGSDDVPVFESTPASRWSFMQRGSVSEHIGPTRSISGSVLP